MFIVYFVKHIKKYWNIRKMNFLHKNIKWVCHHAHLDKSNLITKKVYLKQQYICRINGL